MKMPDHPVPSGDRLMARMLVAALKQRGHKVDLISELRSFSAEPGAAAYAAIEDHARREIERISELWGSGARPDLWFTYHPYYKAPDLLGPVLVRKYGLPYVTAETSYSERRNIGYWAQMQARVLDGIRIAAVNICLTNRDHDGLLSIAPQAKVAILRPFIEPGPFLGDLPGSGADGFRMITVAMMRPGDKLNSYRLLADALARISPDLPWTLSVVGDGVMKAEVAALFSRFGGERITWHGAADTAEIAKLMAQSVLYVWPGFGEAYGLAFLEAQAAGLPVIAQSVAGVPEAVQHGRTGLLTPAEDADAFARGIERLLTNRDERSAMGAAGRQFVLDERTMDRAALRLDGIVRELKGSQA